MKVFFPILKILLLSPLLFMQCVLAQDTDESRWDVSLALGAGIRTNPVMDNDDIPLILIPGVNYQGDKFFIQNLDIGYNLFESEHQQVNLLVTPSYDQVFFNRWDANNFVSESSTNNMLTSFNSLGPKRENKDASIDKHKLHARRMAALGGVEYIVHDHSLEFQLQALHELTGYYQGDEIRFAFSKNIDLEKSQVKLTLGANWQSADTLNYYYGLSMQEAGNIDTYAPAAGLNTLMRIDWNYQLDRHWSLRFFASYRHLNDEITRSPLVTQNNVVTAFAGGVYHF